LKRLAFEEAAAEEDITAKRSVYMPQVSARLERITGTDYFMGQANGSRALLVVDAQPGAGLSAMSGVSAAIARRDAVRQTREAALRDLRERVSLDWNELIAARLRLDNARQARTMSTEVFESYARQYTAGRKTWIDVLNAVREATQSEFAVADADAQVAAATLRLRLWTGDLNVDGAKQ
jgi:adhesin transport system outer membrane protein